MQKYNIFDIIIVLLILILLFFHFICYFSFINSDKLSIEDKLRNMYLTDVMEEKAKSKDDRMDKDVNVVHFFF